MGVSIQATFALRVGERWELSLLLIEFMVLICRYWFEAIDS
jgi:hypothetical protein